MYIFRKHFDGKGIQVLFAISLNVHADVGVGMQEGWQILGAYSQLVPLRVDVCMCGKCESLAG